MAKSPIFFGTGLILPGLPCFSFPITSWNQTELGGAGVLLIEDDCAEAKKKGVLHVLLWLREKGDGLTLRKDLETLGLVMKP